MQSVTARDRGRGRVAGDERALLWRLAHADDDQNAEKHGGTPTLCFRPAVDVVALPARAQAVSFGADWIGVADLGDGVDLGVRADAGALDGALSAFVDLWNGDAEAVASFVRRFGSLRLCPCGAPLGDGFASTSHRVDVTQRRGFYVERADLPHLGRLDDRGLLNWISQCSRIDQQVTRARIVDELLAHSPPQAVLAPNAAVPIGDPPRQVPTTRLAHLDVPDGQVRFERLADWRAEARRVRALLVLVAFVKVALDECGPLALIDPRHVPGCGRGIPFAPIGRSDVQTLLKEACTWHAHDQGGTPLTPQAVLYAVVREIQRRLSEHTCRLAVTLDLPAPGKDGGASGGTQGSAREDAALAAALQARYRAGVSAPSLSAILAVTLAGIASGAIGRGACRAPGCGRALTGRQSVVCGLPACERWNAMRRKRRSRA